MNVGKKTVVTFLAASLIVTGAALSSFSSPVAAKSSSETSPVDVLTSDIVSSAEMILADEIRKSLNIPVNLHDISAMEHHKLGNGEIALAYNLAHASGRSIHDILDMRINHKMGWGKIAKTLGVKLHSAADQSVHILKQSKLDKDIDPFHRSIKTDLDDEDDNDKNKGKKDKDNKNKSENTNNNNNNSNNNNPDNSGHKNNGNPHKPGQGKSNSK